MNANFSPPSPPFQPAPPTHRQKKSKKKLNPQFLAIFGGIAFAAAILVVVMVAMNRSGLATNVKKDLIKSNPEKWKSQSFLAALKSEGLDILRENSNDGEIEPVTWFGPYIDKENKAVVLRLKYRSRNKAGAMELRDSVLVANANVIEWTPGFHGSYYRRESELEKRMD